MISIPCLQELMPFRQEQSYFPHLLTETIEIENHKGYGYTGDIDIFIGDEKRTISVKSLQTALNMLKKGEK